MPVLSAGLRLIFLEMMWMKPIFITAELRPIKLIFSINQYCCQSLIKELL
jgi:hypothetical protein